MDEIISTDLDNERKINIVSNTLKMLRIDHYFGVSPVIVQREFHLFA